MGDVVLGAGEEVIDADDVVTIGQQAFAEVAAKEASAAGNQNPFSECVVHGEKDEISGLKGANQATAPPARTSERLYCRPSATLDNDLYTALKALREAQPWRQARSALEASAELTPAGDSF